MKLTETQLTHIFAKPSTMIIDRIKTVIRSGTSIPRPRARTPCLVVGWGQSRGETALVYSIPARPGTKRRSTKRIPLSALESAYKILHANGELTRDWFNCNLADCAKDGPCNFTTIGGILQLLGEAHYSGEATYSKGSVRSRGGTGE